MKNIDEFISKKMYVLKAIAVFSIILAHTNYFSIESGIDRYCVARLARIGVFIFFFQGGYFFRRKSVREFLNDNLRRIIIPWIFLGSLMYCVGLLTGTKFTVLGYVNHMIGNGSWLYFCTMFLLCKVIAQLLPKNHRQKMIVCFIMLGISIVSLELTAAGFLPDHYDSTKSLIEYVNPYLNILNWIGLFSLGIIVKEYSLVHKLIRCSAKKKILTFLICMLVFLCGYFDKDQSYWSYMGIFTECAVTIGIFLLICAFQNKGTDTFLCDIGKNTFPIYILQFPVLSVLNHVMIEEESIVIVLGKPVLCALMIYCIVKLGEIASKKVHLQFFYCLLMGIKE